MSLYTAYKSALHKKAAAVLTPEAQQMQAGMPPQGMDPAAMGMPPQGAQLPPEVFQDPQFLQFLQQIFGFQVDPQAGVVIDGQTGQPLPPETVMQLYNEYMKQLTQMQGGMPPQGGDPSMMGGMPPQGGDPSMMGGMPPETGVTDTELSPAVMQQVQKTVDDSLRAFTAQLDKKLSALVDKIDVIKEAIEESNNNDDRRTTADKAELRGLQEDLRADLEPSTGIKTASLNVFDLI